MLMMLSASVATQIPQTIEQISNVGNKLDLSLIVAVAALVLAILSPIFSALISGHYQLKEKEIDLKVETKKNNQQFYRQHRAEVIEQYIRSASDRMKIDSAECDAAYCASMGEVLLYLDESLWPLVYKINGGIDINDDMAATGALLELCRELAHKDVRKEDKV